MRVSPGQIDRLAGRIVDAILRQEQVQSKGERAVLQEKVAAIIAKSFEDEEAIEDEAERMAVENARKMPGIDQHRMTQLIKKKLAEERGFPL